MKQKGEQMMDARKAVAWASSPCRWSLEVPVQWLFGTAKMAVVRGCETGSGQMRLFAWVMTCIGLAVSSGCALLGRANSMDGASAAASAATVTVPPPASADYPQFTEVPPLPPAPQDDSGSLRACRPIPPPVEDADPAVGIQRVAFPADQTCPPKTECVDLNAVIETLRKQNEELEARLSGRIASLEADLQQYKEQATKLSTQLDASRRETATLRGEVDHWKNEVTRVRDQFREQEAKDVETLQKLTDMLRLLLTKPELVQGPAPALR